MSKRKELLHSEELYSQGIDMIKSSILGIKQQIPPIKTLLRQRKREILKEIRASGKIHQTCTFDFTNTFYEYALKEIINIEDALEQSLVHINIDLLAAATDRALPPSFLFPEEMRKAYRVCCDALEDEIDEPPCQCTWKNVPYWYFDDTQDIIVKPKYKTRTEFDESDLKFKQDIVYLRTKMFSLPRTRIDLKSGNEIITMTGTHRTSIRLSLKTADFIEALKQKETPIAFSVEDEISRINSLKFVDGKFTVCEIWAKTLDIHGHQYWSKWKLVLCPQIEKIAKKRLIPALHLSPAATFDFLRTITTFTTFTLGRSDLISLLQHKSEAVWLKNWSKQFRMIDGDQVAAMVIQTAWRGYWVRKKRWLSSRLYVAASVIWFAWLTSKQKKQVHWRYLQNMLTSLQTTRELTQKLSNEFYDLIKEPHVIVHLPSLGFPIKLRRTLDPNMFAIFQNITIYRICFVRNPKTEVIYILPVKPTDDLLTMYSDVIESISSDEDVAKRITFIALSQRETFKNRALNVSRILHCSEDTLKAIERKINGKSAYFLPSVIDECDMRVAGKLNIPLLSPDMELQRTFLNASKMSEMIESLGLLQPPHVRNITDYDTLCESLAQLMVLHTEVCMWIMKLNYGIVTKHCGIFLINHISVPFMPVLRREREKHGDNWHIQSSLREEFLEQLRGHLPKVIPNVTQLSKIYSSWKKFYLHMQKYGCLLQAIPMEKKARTVVVSLFIPGKATKRKPRWLGTADKINLEAAVSTIIFMLPQTSLDVSKLQPTVNKLASSMQDRGYFGYMSVDCYCRFEKSDEKVIIWVLNVFPYYTFSHSYLELVKFSIGGWYKHDLTVTTDPCLISEPKNKLVSNIKISTEVTRKKESTLPFLESTPAWNETAERYAIAISQVHHTRLAAYRWTSLKELFERCGISYNRKTKQGSCMILHDGEIRSVGLMTTVSPSMTTTLSMVHNALTKLYHTLTVKTKKEIETNLPELIDFFLKLSLDYQNLAADVCSPSF